MIKNTKNIERAIQQEVIYVVRKAKGEDVKLSDFISPYGYSSVKDFYWDKTLHLLQHSNCVELEEPYIDLKLAKEFLENKIPAFLWTINCPTTYAFIPSDFTDLELLSEYNLEPVKIGYSSKDGGVVISSDGDLRIFLIYPGNLEIKLEHFLTFFKECLSEHFSDVILDGNDILVDKKKVLGSVLIPSGKMGIFVAQVSFSDKREIIEKICGKAVKVPGFVNPKILSPYALKDKFSSWLGIQ